MAWWMIVLLLFYFMVCFVLILSILVQAGKGGGLSSLAGGGGGISETLGATGAEKAMNKITTGVAVGFMLLAMIISVLGNIAYETRSESEIFGGADAPAALDAATGATLLQPSAEEAPAAFEIPADFDQPTAPALSGGDEQAPPSAIPED